MAQLLEAQPAAAKNSAITIPKDAKLSGKKVEVEFLKVKDNEPTDIFVGVGEYQARIKRGVRVQIPVEAFEVIKAATYTELEQDPEHPDDASRMVPVEKSRYPYNVIGLVK